jgi:hypothetical protein
VHKRMTATARAELADAIRPRYAAAAAKEKRKILEQFIVATGYHEKSAIRILNSAPTLKRCQSRQRASFYDEAVRAALIVLWEASDRVCGRRLKALLPILLPALERNGHLKLDEEIRSKILLMSAATVDRLLRAPRNPQSKAASAGAPDCGPRDGRSRPAAVLRAEHRRRPKPEVGPLRLIEPQPGCSPICADGIHSATFYRSRNAVRTLSGQGRGEDLFPVPPGAHPSSLV